ncbi:MAG: tRNA preQ1(34) S-adenosylmethionine ribosyltransferase-isomerase QueA [Myxococcales bacterium]|nr:tRNA preQ1(34) S-adenosylmethionine ribosyltransferase-isomerase QueA [Myxococcales bacterium]
MDRLSDYDYQLPAEQVAQVPAPQRDGARLMVLGPEGPRHHRVADLPTLVPALLGEGALLVVNDTRVIPARLLARKLHGDVPGGAVELLLCDPVEQETGEHWQETWRCLYRARRPLRPGSALALAGDSPPAAEVVCDEGGGRAVVRFSGQGSGGLLAALERIGQVPLPPYIRRPPGPEDAGRYQTVYARVPGAVAAPTAGLHFTEELLAALESHGVRRVSITLHVGPGTFAPVHEEDLSRHVMHAERYHIPEETAEAIAQARRAGRRVLAVGTTVVRALESATLPGQNVPRPGWGESALFIRPPYHFRAVDALLTNFHLPRSTLLMLVSALAGRRRVLAAYAEAVRAGYRFYSYGDAMLIPSPMEDLPE